MGVPRSETVELYEAYTGIAYFSNASASQVCIWALPNSIEGYEQVTPPLQTADKE